MNAPTRVCVIGGAGRVGRAILTHLVSNGFDVTVVDPNHVEVREIARRCYVSCDAVPTWDFTWVVDAAGPSCDADMGTEFWATQALRDRMLLPSFVCKRAANVIALSTLGLYGELISTESVSESTLPRPRGAYAEFKVALEREWTSAGVGLDNLVILRLPEMLASTRSRLDPQHVLDRIALGETPTRTPHADEIRQAVAEDDVSEFVSRLIVTRGRGLESPVNVGHAGSNYRIGDLQALLKSRSPDAATKLEMSPNRKRSFVVDFSRAESWMRDHRWTDPLQSVIRLLDIGP